MVDGLVVGAQKGLRMIAGIMYCSLFIISAGLLQIGGAKRVL